MNFKGGCKKIGDYKYQWISAVNILIKTSRDFV